MQAKYKFIAVFTAMAMLATAGSALAVSGAGAILLQFDLSARGGGMGQSGTAVFWGQNPNHWANPALLGYHRGIRFEHITHPLATGLASDIGIKADRMTVGAYGFGLLLGGQPSPRFGITRLSLGEQEAVDENGNPLGSFESWQQARSFGIGVSLAEAYLNLFRDAAAQGPGWTRYGDLALGYTYKSYKEQLTPFGIPFLPGMQRTASTYDYGLLARATPYNSIDFPNVDRPLDVTLDQLCGGLSFDLAFGLSVLNAKEEWLELRDTDQRDPLPKLHRQAWALRVSTGLPGPIRDGLRSAGLGLLAESLTPLFSFGKTWDSMTSGISWNRDRQEYVFEKDNDEKEEYSGWELSIANIYHIRRGHVKFEAGDIDADTSGWGVGFRIGRIAGWRYDEAEVPQATGLPTNDIRTWTVFCDGLELYDLVRPGP